MAGPDSANDCWACLPNEIWLEILNYLEHADLQAMRLTCKLFNTLTTLPDFLKHSKLIIGETNLPELHKHITENNNNHGFRYQTVEIVRIKQNDKMVDILTQIGGHIKQLTLYDAHVLKDLSVNLPKLEALSVNYEYTQLSPDALDSLSLNDFRHLKSLSLNNHDYTFPLQVHLLYQLVADKTNLKLQQLELRYVRNISGLLFEVLQTHANSLKHLSLYFSTQPTESARDVSFLFSNFCNIQTLMFSGNCPSPWLKVVFESIPNGVPLKNIELSGLFDIDASLIETIVRKWPNTLAQFQLIHSPRANQRALQRFSCLRDNLLMLNLTMCNITNNTLLSGIAEQPNTVLRQLILNDNTDLDEECICQLAERLPNLITLSLNNCRNAVTDNALAAIFRHQVHLRHLYLDDCLRMGDEGLIGFGPEPAPITRLTNLQTLSLRQCRNVSNRALMRAFRFRHLRTLRLGACHRITAHGIEDLVLNCPVIEELVLSSCFMIDDDAVYHIARHLPRLRILNLSNCINLTSNSIDYIIEMCHALRELIIFGIDSLEVLAAQSRLNHFRPDIKDAFF